jgi:hypothetical protein
MSGCQGKKEIGNMKFLKHTAPKVIGINGHESPCECRDTITCAYCVQANLILMEKKFKEDDDRVKSFISHVRKNGVRQSARKMGLDRNTLTRWIKSGNVPAHVVEKWIKEKAA